MKKIVILTLLLSLHLVSFSQASNYPTVDSVRMKEAANEFCNCVSPKIKTIHPFILEMLEVIAFKGENAGEDTLKARLAEKPGEQAAVLKSAEDMESPEFQKLIASCEAKVISKFPFLDDKKEENKSNGEYYQQIMARLPNCKYVYLLSVIGNKADND